MSDYNPPVITHHWHACGCWGNDRIAMVPLRGNFESRDRLGSVELLLVFRKAEDQWKLLATINEPPHIIN